MEGAAVWVFWLALGALLWVYGGFGLLVILWGLLRRREVRKRPVTPKLSLIVAAYNEAQGIEEKLRNVLELDYPREALEIVVASDGSTDGTDAIAARHADHGVRVLTLPRRGKVHALHEAVNRSSGDILVFSDANTLFHPQALRMLARNFADPQVGGVCGNQLYVSSKEGDSSAAGESLYWTYDKWLKRLQSRAGSIVSADGAIYAIRRQLYSRPSSAAVTDDFAISTAVVARGYRLVFESEALAYERTSGAAEREFGRKVRIMNRGLRGVLLRRALLNPFRHGLYSIVLLSHKVLRRLAPAFLLALLASSLLLAPAGGFYLVAAVGQGAFYGLAVAGSLSRATRMGRRKLLCTPFYYCLANAAAAVAIVQLARGGRIERWRPQRHSARV